MAPVSRESTVQSEPTIPNARAFVRSLNVLLKYARLYGLEHSRSVEQFESGWTELREAVDAAGQGGLLLGASGSQLLLDGVPLESSPAERSFADFLTAAGVASIGFLPRVEKGEFANLVKCFMETGPKAATLSDRLAIYFGNRSDSGIRVNEIRFVAEDAGFSEARVAATLTAKTLGADADRIQEWFRSPEKMIQLIAAAEGEHGGAGSPGAHGTSGAGTGTGVGGDASLQAANSGFGGIGRGGVSGMAGGIGQIEEAELQSLLRLLAQFGEAQTAKNAQLDSSTWQQKIAALPQNAQITLQQALATVAAQSPSAKLDENALLRIAEDLAIRFAIERYQRGEVKVNAVRQMLDRMGHELSTLRKLLKSREERMANAGMSLESHADVLDRQFWAAVPESGKKSVLMSSEAWCIPPRNVQQYVEELMGRGESDAAGDILLHYASCVGNSDAEARKKAAIGLGQLAELYSKAASQRLQDTLAKIGLAMAAEKDAELQTLLSAAFVRLSQESAARRYYRAMQQALDSLADLEGSRPSWVQSLRPRIGVDNRIPEFIEEAMVAEALPDGLVGVLMRVPQGAAEHLAVRLARTSRRTERESVVHLAKAVGAPCVRYLKESLKNDAPAKAATVIGLLSRLDPAAVDELLPRRLRDGGRGFHDAVVRQLSTAGAPERGKLLSDSLEMFDVMILPLALDEIGMCGDGETASKLLRLAEGDIFPQGADYLRVKAIEALGRMRAPAAAGHLRRFVEARKTFGWAYPDEIRMAAAQALVKLDPAWIQNFLPQSGLDMNVFELAPLDPIPERDFVRHRRYRRIRLARNVPAVVTSAKGKYSSAISVLSLDGGLLSGELQLPVGTEATLKIPAGLRSISMQAVVRFVRSHQAGFEMVGMNLEDRSKLRRLLVSLGGNDVSGPVAPPPGSSLLDD
ncbi:MAG: PilZ domain-containing protein [Candidatus Acidiferrales bacterium]